MPNSPHSRTGNDSPESSRLSYSPLSSPANSPTRTERAARLPYSSPSRSLASRDSSKYSSIMQYLESELVDGEPGESMQLQRGEDAFEDNLSSMSLSPGRGPHSHSYSGYAHSSQAKSNGAQNFIASVRATARASPTKSVRSQGGRSYVWDEWQQAADDKYSSSVVSQITGDEDGSGGGGGDNASYFSLRAAEREPGDSAASMGSSKSLQRVVGDLKLKIDALKGQLQEKQGRVRELQSELARLSTAKARRVQKFKSAGEAQLVAQRDELGAALKKTSDFVDKLSGDVKQLVIKRDGLKDKHSRLGAHRESALQLLQDEIARKVVRTRRQWDAEEKAVFEKVLKGKEEGLKKAAADSFGPSLDKMVIEGKEAVRARQDEATRRLERIKRDLAAELDSKLAEARETLREQVKTDDEKNRRAGERQLQDALRKHAEETEAFKLKFQRERRMAEEAAERTRRIDAETSLEGMREIHKSESQQAMELMASQQRELAQVVANNAEAMQALKQSSVSEEAALQQRIRNELQASTSQQREKAKTTFLSRLNVESEKVLAKLREEVVNERKAVRDRIESELDDLRMSAQHRLDAMQVAENRAIERVSALRGEIESYKRELANLEEEQTTKAPELTAVRKQLTSLRMEVAGVKQEGESIEARFNEERARRRTKFAREEERLLAELASADEALSRQEVHVANRKEDACAMYASDLTRIRDKVAALLNRKDASARDLRKQLTTLQQRAGELQAQLDESRLKLAMESTYTVEEAMQRVGVPPRQARGSAGRSFVP